MKNSFALKFAISVKMANDKMVNVTIFNKYTGAVDFFVLDLDTKDVYKHVKDGKTLTHLIADTTSEENSNVEEVSHGGKDNDEHSTQE